MIGKRTSELHIHWRGADRIHCSTDNGYRRSFTNAPWSFCVLNQTSSRPALKVIDQGTQRSARLGAPAGHRDERAGLVPVMPSASRNTH